MRSAQRASYQRTDAARSVLSARPFDAHLRFGHRILRAQADQPGECVRAVRSSLRPTQHFDLCGVEQRGGHADAGKIDVVDEKPDRCVRRALELAAIAAIALAVGNGIYGYHQTESTLRTGSLSDLLWLAGLCLLVLAGLHPDAGDAATEHLDLAGRSLLGYAPTLAALGVGVWRLVDGSGYDGVRSALIAGIGVAVLANQLTSYAEN